MKETRKSINKEREGNVLRKKSINKEREGNVFD